MSRGMVAPPALLHLVFFGYMGLLVMPRCRRAAAMRVRWARRAARPHSSAAGQAAAIAILMRRTEMRTSAPIFRSLRRIVPQVASSLASACSVGLVSGNRRGTGAPRPIENPPTWRRRRAFQNHNGTVRGTRSARPDSTADLVEIWLPPQPPGMCRRFRGALSPRPCGSAGAGRRLQVAGCCPS